jgi:hypothetical protein
MAMKVTRKKTLHYEQAFSPAAALERKKYLLRHWRARLKKYPLVYLDEIDNYRLYFDIMYISWYSSPLE